MTSRDRRQFLKQSASLAAATVLGSATSADGAEAAPVASAPLPLEALTARGAIPPHRAIQVPGIHAYAEKSLRAGESIRFRVSSTVPYRLEVCRLAGDVDDPKSDVVLNRLPAAEPLQQPIHPGSYVHVDKRLPANDALGALTLECWVRPWQLTAWQGIVTQYDFPDQCGVGLFLDKKGQPQFYIGDGQARDASRMIAGPMLNHRRWSHVAGTFDGKTATLWVNGRRVGSREITGEVRPGPAPLRLGAYGDHGAVDHFLEGDIAMPAIYSQALSADEIKERIDRRGLSPPITNTLLACWPLAEERGAELADIGPKRRSGRIINHATWMIGGPSFHGDRVGRYDASYDPAKDPNRGHGLRFASDDLFDCRWTVTHEVKIPNDAKSGVYVGRFHYVSDGHPRAYHATFIVRRGEDRPQAPILVLCSSSTWLAYGATPLAAVAGTRQFWGTGGLASSPAGAPAYCCYRDHQAGQPTYYLGLKMPWPAAGPDVLYSPSQIGYSHLMRGELFAHRWLDGHYGDHPGYAYDVVTDLDLDRDPQLLDGYKTLVINGHSEYWSVPAMHGVDRFLKQGGTAVVLSGNTMFWRTSFDGDGSVMECRKFDPRIGGRGGAVIGELYHSHDKQRGSLMRECGYPAWQYVGLDCIGWDGVSISDQLRVYEVSKPDHPLFNEPEKVGLAKGATFGHAPRGGVPRAVGHEWDVRLSTLKRMTLRVPAGATLPAEEPAGITTVAVAHRPGGGKLDYFTNNSREPNGICAEMIYWERPTGGRVFNAGAIAAGWALSGDPNLRTLLRNVLHHFGVAPAKS